MPLPPAYRAIILDQQAQLQRLVQRAGIVPVRALYERMLADATSRISVTPAQTFTHQQLTVLLAQIRLGLARLQPAVAEVAEDSARQVGIHAARTLLTDAAKLERHFTGAAIPLPLLEVGRLEGLVEGQIPSLMRAHDTSMARYGTQLVRRMEGELGTSLALGESHATAIDRVMRVGDLEWSRAERIVRTESAFAANRSARAAADEQAVELEGDMWSRWTEHVSDEGTPLDDRVGVDSEAMHGQVAPPDGTFTQPPSNRQGEPVGDSLVGREWTCPPNRPNDRAVLVPWRAHWGVPGWQWEDGRRVPVTEDRARRANDAWMRSRGMAPEVGDGEGLAPIGPGFAPAAAPEEIPEIPDEEIPEIPAGPGFASPMLAPLDDEIPEHGDLPSIGKISPRVDPQAIADHGWFEPPGYEDDLARAERAYQQVADGLEHPIGIGVTPADNLVVHSAEDAARLNAAAHSDAPVPVRWEPAQRVPRGHVAKAGEDGEIPGLGDRAPEVVREMHGPFEEHGPALPTPLGPRMHPGESSEAFQARRHRELFGPGAPKEQPPERYGPEPAYGQRLRADERRAREDERRFRERYERANPPPAPPGYEVVEDFPGVRTYVSHRTGRRYTEDDVRRHQLDPPVPAEDFPVAQSRSRARSFLAGIGRGLRSIGRALTGR